jgi:hypothetical protein
LIWYDMIDMICRWSLSDREVSGDGGRDRRYWLTGFEIGLDKIASWVS